MLLRSCVYVRFVAHADQLTPRLRSKESGSGLWRDFECALVLHLIYARARPSQLTIRRILRTFSWKSGAITFELMRRKSEHEHNTHIHKESDARRASDRSLNNLTLCHDQSAVGCINLIYFQSCCIIVLL